MRIAAQFNSYAATNVVVRWGYGLEDRLARSHSPKAIEIVRAVSQETGVSVAELKGRRTQKHIAHARQLAMWRVRNECPHMSYPQIGRIFGNRDHTTILHACKKFDRIMGERK